MVVGEVSVADVLRAMNRASMHVAVAHPVEHDRSPQSARYTTSAQIGRLAETGAIRSFRIEGMEPITAAEAAHQPLISDGDVQKRVESLIGRACRRQLWMLFTDDTDIQTSDVIAIDDYPTSPDDGNAELLAARISDWMSRTDAANAIFVWERRVGERFTPADRAWAKALAGACRACAVSVRAQLISHRTGVRWFAPDDYA
jgi:hypothetical protein